jgi:predicted amidophosphoribosyltransferase
LPDEPGRVAAALALCMACRQFVRAGETVCPHCGASLSDAADRRAAVMAEAKAAAEALEALMRAARIDYGKKRP